MGLVNGSMGIIQEILFEDQEPLALFKAVLIKFEKYNRLTIKTTEGEEVIPIAPIKRR